MKKVLYIFSGSRHRLQEDIRLGEAPDTQLYGMNHLSTDYVASTREFGTTRIGSMIGRLIGFRLRHALMYFSIGSADIVFGSSLLYMLPFKKLFGTRARFVLLNISLNRFLSQQSARPFIYRLCLNLLKSVDCIVSLSKVQQQELIERHGIDQRTLAYIPLGVDTSFYQPKFEGRANYLLSVGRDNGRDYKTLFEVARMMPDEKFQCVMSKRNLINVGSVPQNVTIFFDLPIGQVREKYREAAALLLITHADGYVDGSDCSGQTVFLDACASGLPIISTRKAYIADYAEDRQEVMLVDCYNPVQIVESIRSLRISGGGMARNAWKRVRADFSTQDMGRKLSELFRTL